MLTSYMSVYSYCIVVACVTCILCNNNVPLVEHLDVKNSTRHSKPGCWFGRSFYRLEQTWKPILHPLGEMVCVLCTCHPVHKNNKLHLEGNVECHNIKRTCPEVTCQNARVPPGQCCQTCPNEDGVDLSGSFSRVRQLGYSRNDIDTPHMDQSNERQKVFVSLLVGKSAIIQEKSKSVGSARLTLLNNHFSYAIKLSRLQGATSLSFRESRGTLLYERDLSGLNTDLVCGTWTSLPNIYINYLQEGRMYMVISSKRCPDGEISGKIRNHRALQKETLSSVLIPNRRDSSGALVMMYFSTDNNLIVSVLHSGIAHKKINTAANIVFLKKKKKVKVITINLSPQESETTAVWRKPSKRDLKILVRGRLEIALYRGKRQLMKGNILHKQTCNVLQAILSPTGSTKSGKMTPKKTVTGGVGAVALFRVTPKGKLEYSIQFSGNEADVSKVYVQSGNQRRKAKPICTIVVPSSSDNAVSGSCGSVKAQTLQMLYQRRLNVKVMSRPQLTGSIRPMIYHEDSFTNGIHVLLTSSGQSTSFLVGHAWLSVSRLCQLNYLIALDDKHLQADGNWKPYLIDTNTRSRQLLEGVAANMARGVAELSVESLESLKKGDSKLIVVTTNYPDGEVMSVVKIDNNCGQLLKSAETDGDVLPNERPKTNRPSIDHKVTADVTNHCMVNSIKYLTNEVFIPVSDPCTTCNCEKGKVTCHPMECVDPVCDNPIQLEGDCCPQCPDSSFSAENKCFFDGDKRHHHFGTVFHPYVIPFGYQKCAVCSCATGENDVVCARLPCPKLSCPQKMAVRPNPDDCCMTCPDGFSDDITDPPPLSSKDIINKRKACEVQGSTYPPGEVWKPRVGPFGTMPCITCQCLNGTPMCSKQICPTLDCPLIQQIKGEGRCCPQCAETLGPISDIETLGSASNKR